MGLELHKVIGKKLLKQVVFILKLFSKKSHKFIQLGKLASLRFFFLDKIFATYPVSFNSARVIKGTLCNPKIVKPLSIRFLQQYSTPPYPGRNINLHLGFKTSSISFENFGRRKAGYVQRTTSTSQNVFCLSKETIKFSVS